jgi:glutaredoxin
MKIAVVTQQNCEHCEKIKEYLSDKGYTFTIIPIDDQGGTQMRRFLGAMDIPTVPAVFVDGTHIGGNIAAQWWFDQQQEHTGGVFLNG